MNPSEIVIGRAYIVKVGGDRWMIPVEVNEIRQNLIKIPDSSSKCPQSFLCTDLQEHKPIVIQCVKQFVRFAVAKDYGATPCEMVTRVRDQGYWDRRKCVLPAGHKGQCLTSLYLCEGMPTNTEGEQWISSLLDDDPSEYEKIRIPRADWPTFEL